MKTFDRVLIHIRNERIKGVYFEYKNKQFSKECSLAIKECLRQVRENLK